MASAPAAPRRRKMKRTNCRKRRCSLTNYPRTKDFLKKKRTLPTVPLG
jgi:hypothetical protein